MADREFLLKIVGDVSSAQKSIGQLEKDVSGFKSTAGTIGKTIVGAIAVDQIVGAGKAVVNAASDQEQAIGALHSVYGAYSDDMDAFGKTTAENLGISRAEFSQLAAVTGSMLKNAGVPLDEVASSTQDLTARAADMAAMFGGTVPEAMEAINSALKGERDPIEKYGVSLKESAVQAKAVEMGLVDAEGKVTDYGKAMATQALIMEQSADAAGTFEKESGSLAGQQAVLTAQFKDMQAEIGQQLLPIIVKLAGVLMHLVTFVKNNQGWLIPLAAGIAGVVLAVKAYQMAQTAWAAATKVASAAQWVWNAAMSANPIMLIVIAIAAVIAIVVLLYMKVDWFRDMVDAAIDGIVAAWNWLLGIIKGVFEWVKKNWPLLLAIITGPIGTAVYLISKNWDTIKNGAKDVVSAIGRFFGTVWDIISAPFKKGAEIIGSTVAAIKDWFWRLPGQIATFFTSMWDIITAPFRRASDTVSGIISNIKDMFWRLPGQIGNFMSVAADIIKWPFQKAFDGIKWLWNSTVGGFGFTVPSWVPFVGGKEFRIPEMAAGGIVSRPTIALLGEAGPEAVVPLSRGGMGMGGVVINVYALTANAEVGRKVYEALNEYSRVSGRSIA